MKSIAYLQCSDIEYYMFLAISIKKTQYMGNRKCPCALQFKQTMRTSINTNVEIKTGI